MEEVGTVGKKWLRAKRRDYYYRRAKRENYRSRAAYKLKQINERFHVIRRGYTVVDLGSSPGGWSQVAMEIVGPTGKVVAVDMASMRPLDGVTFIRGDAREDGTLRRVLEAAGGRVDAVISDMAPNISGHYATDHARSMELARVCLEFSLRCLSRRGVMVVKVFQGDLFPDYLKEVKRHFESVRCHSPRASRRSSSEMYVIAKNPLPPANRRVLPVL